MKAIFAPYDELTKATLSAIEQHAPPLKVAAYGIVISKADIDLMTKKDSPWKATATTDPRAVGAESRQRQLGRLARVGLVLKIESLGGASRGHSSR